MKITVTIETDNEHRPLEHLGFGLYEVATQVRWNGIPNGQVTSVGTFRGDYTAKWEVSDA